MKEFDVIRTKKGSQILFTILSLLFVFSLTNISYAQESSISRITDKAGTITTLADLQAVYKAKGLWVNPLAGRGADPPEKRYPVISYSYSGKINDKELFEISKIKFSEIKEIKFSYFSGDPCRIKATIIKKRDGSIITITSHSHISGVIEEFDSKKSLIKHTNFFNFVFTLRGEPELFLDAFTGQRLSETDQKIKLFSIPFYNVVRIEFQVSSFDLNP